MIRKLQINNYKSLHELELDVGRFNVLIGENGCGKSNVLEAIALAAAAAADNLDSNSLHSRGIRVPEPQLMRAAFSKGNLSDPINIELNFNDLEEISTYSLVNDNQPYSEWIRLPTGLYKTLEELMTRDDVKKLGLTSTEITTATEHYNRIEGISDNSTKLLSKFLFGLGAFAYIAIKAKQINDKYDLEQLIDRIDKLTNIENKLKNFLIYSPENSALRNFSKEGQIEPLGINGEGLLKLLKVIQSKSPEQLEEIVTCLELFDWFDGLHIPKDFSSYEDKVTITDRFLSTAFDQRSANEGFLFVLFYIALMVSDDAPKIFAIDNIDVALNPKLCTKLIKELVRLAKKYDKQVFVTTHNPAILDGIDLGDDEQRLLVLSRNKEGHTRVKRIELKDKPRSATKNSKGEYESLKLSEAFLRGYLGGLPKGF